MTDIEEFYNCARYLGRDLKLLTKNENYNLISRVIKLTLKVNTSTKQKKEKIDERKNIAQ